MGRRLHGDFRSGEVAPIWHRSDLTGCSVVSVETHARAVALLLIAPNVPVRAPQAYGPARTLRSADRQPGNTVDP